ncbi:MULTISPECIES: ATP-dependent helicase [unclassified Colwellia]|uniref:ATP-dependent helicase n=1 Tax=unclassified Colwellia TaxID=196834 RepID=UPI0015F4241D|nr:MULTISPECIES: ATP-dependent helicase [unclassified Colwellia]MBA6380524.1 ATP-dependent helicase [Colwellia sp. BRX10-7]MBA6388051.1 ATP-dependent helicase [Colwellia sp. BRX10-2]MBA6403048.1 ATP-dependent helicase [Colwellia sp. BRX10-5]MBA6405971.1 ATP-dependent helicase [Colwellia sp. BRX10-1]
MMTLSPNQELVVKSELDKNIQVLASAGSGKTRVLTERVRYILEQTKKDRVIALTFTNKAAEEMVERLSDSEEAVSRTWISTIHSLSQSIIEQYGHTIGLPSELNIYDRDKDRMEIFLQSLRDDGINIDDYLDVSDSREHRNRQTIMQKYMDAFSTIKREFLTEDEALIKFAGQERIWKIYQDYQSALLNSGGIDYDDILFYGHQLLLNYDWISNIYRTKYKHVCVDEAQDLNRAQYEFIKVFCGQSIKSLLMVGDPNQMIYGFNSSSSDFLCDEFIRDFKPLKFELKENYRSTKSIINVANKLKPNSQEEHSAALVGGVTFNALEDEYVEAQLITSQIKFLLEMKTHAEIEGDISLDHMVVIARNRFVFSALEEKLSNENIKYFLKKGERLAEPNSLFGKVLDYGLRVKLTPKDWVDGKKLCKLLKISPPNNWGEEKQLYNWSINIDSNSDVQFPELQSTLLKELEELDNEEPKIRKFVAKFDEKLKALASISINDKEKLELEMSISELNDFKELWLRFKKKGIGDSLKAFRNAMALGQITESMNNTGITLSTVHTMKGLEKDIVFLMGMCEGVFPDYRANSNSEISEERNSAFVAVTRAKRWLYISHPEKRTMPWGDVKWQQVSRFVKEMQ